ncbi:unnamed protein product [Polarella glacialis]|uniref:Uncharacterized protein n=1 Tax=Polarella glacialis TaxID=89957 RepID=A0A813FJB3_POLGL|nr:unnamed protein product [Polarella glacialis]
MADGLRPAQFGHYFWHMMVYLPVFLAFCFTAVKGLFFGPTDVRGFCIVFAEGLLVGIFSCTGFQAPLWSWWHKHVECNMGMPPWVHWMAGSMEFLIVGMRLFDTGGGPAAAMLGGGVDAEVAKRCALAHFVTCGLMGGALWTWPFGVRVLRGPDPNNNNKNNNNNNSNNKFSLTCRLFEIDSEGT